MNDAQFFFTTLLLLLPSIKAACTANTSSTTDIQNLLQTGGKGYTLSLCQSQTYSLDNILNFTAANQEISTENYPTDDTRATLVVTGFNVSVAVQGTGFGLNGIKLRNIQINGNRGNSPIYQASNGLIEMGGDNQNQVIEYVHPYDPRGWSCMHLAEGPFTCANMTVQYNDVGPCGSESFQQWSDGISLSCSQSLVQHNVITDPTDGGIVVFGAPFSEIRNNTIHVKSSTLLGGINLVDVLPWNPPGNYSGTVVEDNHIIGGWATGYGNETLGTQNSSAMIKIGIAIGPRTWFNDQFKQNVSSGGVVRNNDLSGAFAFGIALSSARNFVISNNSFINNVSFIGTYGPNCSTSDLTPHPPIALVSDSSTMQNVTVTLPPPTSNSNDNFQFVNGTVYGMTCFLHPGTNDFAWPYGGGGVNALQPGSGSGGPATGQGGANPSSSKSGAAVKGMNVGLGAAWVGALSSVSVALLGVAGGAALLL